MFLRLVWYSCFATVWLTTPAFAVTVSDHTLARPEGSRHYIALEAEGKPKTKRPVLILLHGHGASAAVMVGLASLGGYKTEAWSTLTSRENILLLAPDGVTASDGKKAWNDCRSDAPTNTTVDDVGFVAALIDTAIAQFDADPERVYVYGVSHGGAMAYRVGIELGPRLAAIGVQSGLMAAQNACPAPSTPLSVFIEHGTADEIVPYAGGKAGSWFLHGRGSTIGAEQSVTFWRKLAGLPETPVTYRFPHLRKDDPTSATRYVWGTSPAGVQVEFLRIDGGGHVDAAKNGTLPWLLRKLVGEMNHDLDTAEEAWSFFKTKRNTGVHAGVDQVGSKDNRSN
jgi:polyhydroxybutyrate depolymerase